MRAFYLPILIRKSYSTSSEPFYVGDNIYTVLLLLMMWRGAAESRGGNGGKCPQFWHVGLLSEVVQKISIRHRSRICCVEFFSRHSVDDNVAENLHKCNADTIMPTRGVKFVDERIYPLISKDEIRNVVIPSKNDVFKLFYLSGQMWLVSSKRYIAIDSINTLCLNRIS